ncbi:similar to Saccharomyces cerevisiae YHR121W LSM12 Protein of unknown function that may function in RNA processing [Maudiozyma saulgeensis]|uniref:AD domain-containing protein n=1 Tax=Maudiozyma saulgeensis TaxID=1789683 RepID=A0A1X7QYU7_9SACH|nr:similar to Saccharomyces cerevisiae YHR121W LSM12 Protein of unknown function that may function in RNA processing [Kazachstania saulgeensis]
MGIDLQYILGFRVKVTNLIDGVTEGKIYSFNSSNGTIILQTAKKGNFVCSFKMIKCSFIKRLDVIDEQSKNNTLRKQPLKPSYVNIDKIQNLLRDIIEGQNKSTIKSESQTPEEGKTVFDILAKTIPDVEWQGRDIVVLKHIKVMYPYKIENVVQLKQSDNSNSFQLVKKIVERGWSQIEEDGGRKGG